MPSKKSAPKPATAPTQNIVYSIQPSTDDDATKKRGRKSRGGKLISKIGENADNSQPIHFGRIFRQIRHSTF